MPNKYFWTLKRFTNKTACKIDFNQMIDGFNLIDESNILYQLKILDLTIQFHSQITI